MKRQHMIVGAVFFLWCSLEARSLKDLSKNITASITVKNTAPLTKKEIITKEVPLAESGKVTLVNKAGFIKVIGWDKKTVSAEITKLAATDADLKKIVIEMECTKDKVSFVTTYDEHSLNANAEVQYIVKVPRTAVLDEIAVGSGAIFVEGTKGRVIAQTGSGNITLTDVTGPLTAVTGSGTILIMVESTSAEPLKLKAGAGSITVNHSGGSVDASTGSGSITVDQRSISGKMPISLQTGSGSISLKLPDNVDAFIEGKLGSGTFSSDFDEVTKSKELIAGTLGKGGASIKLATGSGSISLKKR